MQDNHFSKLSAFVAVAEHRHFAKAAAQLQVSRSALTQAIRLLEEHLGVRLLNRNNPKRVHDRSRRAASSSFAAGHKRHQ